MTRDEILYDKTAGASDGNVTKYWEEIKPEWQGQPWCCCFITFSGRMVSMLIQD